jgi:hypothetical protein
MKIALLGAPASGKTVYFSGLAYKFRNAIAFRRLAGAEAEAYRRAQVSRQLGLRISVSSSDLEHSLSENVKLLSQRPIDQWPDPTTDLDRSIIQCQFNFRDIGAGKDRSPESYSRTIELYDPPGEVFRGGHSDSDDIVEELGSCDMFVAFLPGDRIVECARQEDADLLQNELLLGKIVDIMMDVRQRMPKKDILPLCFVISMADLVTKDLVDTVNRMVYDELLIPFSEEHPNLLICVCPVSVLDPSSGSFRAFNLEWPFLFAAGGTIFRNSLDLRKEASSAQSAARRAEQRAQEIVGGGWWNRFKQFMKGEGAGVQRRRAQSYRNEFGRLISEADDDRALARNVWSSIAIEGRWRNVRVFMEGDEIDPRVVIG